MPESNEHEPLLPEPLWRQVNSNDWTSDTYSFSLSHTPAAFERGFAEGAYALARHLRQLMATGHESEAFKLLMRYESGSARPVRGWKHEPKRN